MQNPDAIVVVFSFRVPAGNVSAGGIDWIIALPNGETKEMTTHYTTDKGIIISCIKGFMSQYNKRVADYSGVLLTGDHGGDHVERIEGIIEQ